MGKMPMPRRHFEERLDSHTKIEKLFIPGPSGALEALLEWNARAPAVALCALVCHPHPVFGGTMHHKVVFRATKAALQAGLAVLRFNFRGAGKSEGEFGEGIGERDDARAALDFLGTRFPKTPVVIIGFSFGAWVGMAVGADDPRVVALVGLGLPGGPEDFAFIRDTRKPKLIIQGTQDIYGPYPEIETVFNSLQEPKRLHWLEGADHFFSGRLDEVQKVIRDFLQQIAKNWD
ncbi:MAG: alpha/beta fold hydrolase [Terriglobia bacterium]